MNTLVIGLGNPILTDDGVGVKVAYQVSKALSAIGSDVADVIEACVGGLRLMEMMIGYDRVVLIDALCKKDGREPGKIHRMSLEDLCNICPTQHSSSAHDTSLVTALELGRRIGLKLPSEISIVAIEIENPYEFGDQPTPAVARSIPEAVDMVLEELQIR